MTQSWALAVQENRYGSVLANQPNSPTLKAIWRRCYGSEYPEELEPFGFVTRTELQYVLAQLKIGQGKRLVDLGCGRGGPGLWVAGQAGADLVGLDIVPPAVTAAAALRARNFQNVKNVGFVAASCTEIPLRANTFDAAMSVDVLWMVLEKEKTLAEIGRILQPGGRLVLTTWQPGYLNHADLLEAAGFRQVTSWSPPDWYSRQMSVYTEIITHQDALRTELGNHAADILIAEAHETPSLLTQTQRVIITAVMVPEHRPHLTGETS